jgi:tetratricopeptide (TPR) repeat protein
MEGARRIDEWSRIEKRIPHLGVVPALAPAPAAGGDLDLLPPEWEVLALIDARRDVRALAAALGRSDFEVAKTLFGLESAGVITLDQSGPRGAGVSGDVAALVAQAEEGLRRRDFEPARAAAEQAAALQPQDADVHVLLGRLHLAAGRAPAALESLRRAQRLQPAAAATHRHLGYALAQAGRFQEAVDVWDQWERLAANTRSEAAYAADVSRAREAARVLAGAQGVISG